MCSNFSHLSDPKFDIINNWIRDKQKGGKDWNWLSRIGNENWLKSQHEVEEWPLIKEEEWLHIVKRLKQLDEDNMLKLKQSGMAIIVGSSDENNLPIPSSHDGAWQTYKRKLKSNGFTDESINSIEMSAHNVVKRISTNTQDSDPIKGLVIGNVQSGKTANMAAVMSMAADHGWNLFIILSGTLENLRIQTKERLEKDLESDGTILWKSLDQLCKSTRKKPCQTDFEPDRIGLSNNSKNRSFVVCLKNTTRLKDLYNWLNWYPEQKKLMKILVIDDECDQGSINTATNKKERTAINNWICRIINDTNNKGDKNHVRYAAMNYIGYTATPYANILNETEKESLYPRNFILTLPVSNEYLGPQQIFGCENTPFEGLDIIRKVDTTELLEFKDIHKGNSKTLPNSLKKAICWFLCSVSAMRLAGYKKPISMLVHTSHQILHHERLTVIIQNWFKSASIKDIIKNCEIIWKEETSRFSRDSFLDSYTDYGSKDILHHYPHFSDIEQGIKLILKRDITPVMFDSNDDLTYHDGIHLCVDNSANNPSAGDIENWRLCYPSSKMTPYPSPAPAFIVIGGATLSRGLTIEGLTSTFFLREVGTADSLMQMGRWFGYRKGYELYPRIWMSEKTTDKFSALAILDQNLRDEISWMSTTGNPPSKYAARLDHFGIIKLAPSNKTQAMMPAEMDFRGSFNQTYIFDNDSTKLSANLTLTKDFIESLGSPEQIHAINEHAKNCNIWRGITLDTVLAYLSKFYFNQKLTVFKDLAPLAEWMTKLTQNNELKNWNIILAGKSSGKKFSFTNCSTTMVQRTQKANAPKIPGTINIGVLSAPTDILADIDLNSQSEEFKKQFAKEKDYEKLYKKLRYDAGLTNVPQLIIYIVDKDSMASQKSLNAGTREHLNAPTDIVGICINVPGAPKNGSQISKVHAYIMQEDGDDIE